MTALSSDLLGTLMVPQTAYQVVSTGPAIGPWSLMLAVAALVVVVAFVGWSLVRRSGPQRQKLALLEKALDREDLSGAERAALHEALRVITRPSRLLPRLCFSLGWLGLFGGGFLFAMDAMDLASDPLVSQWGLGLAVGGIALVTLPLALRELDRHEAGAANPAATRS